MSFSFNPFTGTFDQTGGEGATYGAKTFTGLVTLAPAAANTGLIASTSGYSLTGSNATSMVNLNGTWNTSGAPKLLKANVTDTASATGSMLLDLQRNSASMLSVMKDGALQWGDQVDTGHRIPVLFSRGYYGDVFWTQGGINNIILNNPIEIEGAYLRLNSPGAAGSGGVMLIGSNVLPGVLQLGGPHPTTPTAQTIKAHDVTTGTGASLTLAGGTGSVAGGAVSIATSTTNGSSSNRISVSNIGQSTFTPNANVQALTVSGSETGAGATRALVSISDVWTNSSGNVAPRLLDLEVTDTGITSGTIDYGNTALIRGRRNGTDVFRVDHGGTMNLGSGQCYLDTNAAKIQIAYFWNYSVNGDVWLGRDDSAVWRLGLTHPTTPTAQTLKAHDVATGTGAGLTLAGGRGSVAGGDVVLAVSANSGTAAAALTCTAAGAVVVASGRTFQMGNAAATGLAAGALAATTNASLIIHDSTGQAYRIPCVI